MGPSRLATGRTALVESINHSNGVEVCDVQQKGMDYKSALDQILVFVKLL